MLDSEFRPYIDPPAQRKDLPEDPLAALIRQFMFQLRKREIVIPPVPEKRSGENFGGKFAPRLREY